MTAEIGLFSLIVCLALSLFMASMLGIGQERRVVQLRLFTAGAWLQCALATLALGMLAAARVQSDFSVVNVAQHSNRALPLLYKIVGTWGNHEGSMLLWVWVLTVFAALLAPSIHRNPPLVTTALAVQNAATAGVLAFILLASNPFTRQFPPPFDGAALNPILQDIALAMHPPLLYLGYVGFSVTFSLACAGLLLKRLDSNWAAFARPWMLAAWSCLTLGIGLGSWWAYRELGWGGYWFWDPVENASLLPWLAGTALIHSNLVLKKRGALAQWVALLAILTFAMSLIGTFLVRSGLITSVHSFASDPMRGLFILGYTVLLIGGALVLYTVRITQATQPADPVPPLSREGLIVVQNLLMVAACFTVLLGTVYPVIAEWLGGDALAVGAPYFNATVLPMLAFTAALAGIGINAAWGQDRAVRLLRTLRPAITAALAGAFTVLALAERHLALGALGLALALWLFSATVRYTRNTKFRELPVTLAHLGAAFVALGITVSALWSLEREVYATPGDSFALGPYAFAYTHETGYDTGDYRARIAQLRVMQQDRIMTTLSPEYRLYSIRNTATSEAAIAHRLWGDIYAVATEPTSAGIGLRLHITPLVWSIWLGVVLMALGGAMAATRTIRKSHATS